MIDIILVGPWSRLCNDEGIKKEFLTYIYYLRSHNYVNKIIYSSSDKSDTVANEYFDVVCSNNEYLSALNNSADYYNNNTNMGLKCVDSEFVLRVRSDLYIFDLDFMAHTLFENPDKIIVDYYIKHSLLIPYFYSDFLFACKSEIAGKFIGSTLSLSNNNEKFITLSPHKLMTAGHIRKGYGYNEYKIWSAILHRLGWIKDQKEMYQLSVIDFIKSHGLIREKFLFIGRHYIFAKNEKFEFYSRLNWFFYKDKTLNNSALVIIVLSFLHLSIYIKDSARLIIKKWIMKDLRR
jgi:hypothetical protein